MFLITRVSKVPGSPLQVQIDAPPNDGSSDAGFQQGGVYYFQPAGTEGDRHQVPSEFAARAIMDDKGLAPHFKCEPALAAAQPAAAAEPAASQAAEAQPDGAAAARRRRTAGDQG